MNVQQILETKGAKVIKLESGVSAMEAAKALATYRIGAVPIMDGDKLVGIISERDLVRAVAANGHESLDCPVTDLMTRGVSVCDKDTSVSALMTMMTDRRIRHVPVVEDGALIGMVSIGDVVKERLEEATQEAEALKSYIATG